jgi:hypothetical protein
MLGFLVFLEQMEAEQQERQDTPIVVVNPSEVFCEGAPNSKVFNLPIYEDHFLVDVRSKPDYEEVTSVGTSNDFSRSTSLLLYLVPVSLLGSLKVRRTNWRRDIWRLFLVSPHISSTLPNFFLALGGTLWDALHH